MLDANAATVIEAAADLIEPPGRHATRALAVDARGAELSDPHDERAVAWCAVGAVQKVCPEGWAPITDWLSSRAVKEPGFHRGMGSFNDAIGHARTVAFLRRAANELRTQGESR